MQNSLIDEFLNECCKIFNRSTLVLYEYFFEKMLKINILNEKYSPSF